MRFSCVSKGVGCNHCCIWRPYLIEENKWVITKDGRERPEYVPLGKQGIELLSSEVRKFEKYAHKLRNRVDDEGKPIKYQILPLTAVTSEMQKTVPTKNQIDSYQMMGRTNDGNICPFLSTLNENVRSEIGTLACLIYNDRFLMCHAYPVSKLLFAREHGEITKYVTVHTGCDWVARKITEEGMDWLRPENQPISLDKIKGLDFNAMMRIQRGKFSNLENTTLWRYATHIGNEEDQQRLMPEGWVNWGWS